MNLYPPGILYLKVSCGHCQQESIYCFNSQDDSYTFEACVKCRELNDLSVRFEKFIPLDMEEIKYAAIRTRCGLIWSLPRPARHGHVIKRIWETRIPQEAVTDEQGFTTTHGRFVTREEAFKIALVSGQLATLPDKVSRLNRRLFSEDLW